MTRLLRLGSRSSPMALAQAERVRAALARLDPFANVEVVPVTTRADNWAGNLAALGGKGHFVRELDAMLLAGEVDMVVHCVKDMESDRGFPEGTTVAAFMEREDVHDVLIRPGRPPVETGDPLASLPSGARVGTSSVRRRAQLRAVRPDLVLLECRGNVNTRLERLRAGAYDALVLAASGLARVGRAHEATAVLPVEAFLPPAGAGVIAVACRERDSEMQERLRRLDHAATRVAALAERACLARLQGNCASPIAAHARMERGRLVMRAAVYAHDGATVVESHGSGSPLDPSTLGEYVGGDLLDQGAADLIAEAHQAKTAADAHPTPVAARGA